MQMRLQSAILQICVACFVLSPDTSPAAQAARLSLVVVERHPTPVITVGSPGAEGNVYGFENGFAQKLRGTYHIFIAEIFGEPRLVNMKLAHWTSPDRLHWKRMATLYTSSGEFTGKDERAALWGPAVAYDHEGGRWNLYYTAYRSAPNTPDMWRLNTDGKIWRAVSQTAGIDGIGGPYQDVGIVLQAGKDSQPWEGEQGTDSFAPYKVGKLWYSFYGSAHLKKTPDGRVKGPWLNGLVSAHSLAGPWKRLPNNPVSITNVFIEAPIVTKLEDGTYVTVYDNEPWLSRIRQVSLLLGHSSVKITERHYAPFCKERQNQLAASVKLAWRRARPIEPRLVVGEEDPNSSSRSGSALGSGA